MSLDIDSLRVFVRVAELRSFTQAAAQLAMPKARASAYVQRLEAELGARLLHRSTRVVELTAEGEQLMVHARTFLADADELGTMFHGAGALRGRVRVELPLAIATEYVMPRVSELLGRHPGIALEICASDRVVDAVRDGLDIVLRTGRAETPGMTGRRLGELTMMNGASAAYLRQYGLPTTLEALSTHRVIGYAGDPSPGFEYLDGTTYRTVAMPTSIVVDNTETYLAAAVAGLGIVQFPRHGRGRGVEHLVEILPEYAARPIPISLLHTHGRSVPRRVRAVMNWLVELLAPLASDLLGTSIVPAVSLAHRRRAPRTTSVARRT